MSFYSFYLIILFVSISKLCSTEKLRYISTENPQVTYINPKYISYANMTAQRYGRDPFYYVQLHFYSLYEFGNNVTAHIHFHEFLMNRYKRVFVEMHFKWCDFLEKDKFIGAAFKQGKLNIPCPYPAGEYNLYNMTIPLKHIPKDFPFTKGRIYANFTGTVSNELLSSGFIDMEIKETQF